MAPIDGKQRAVDKDYSQQQPNKRKSIERIILRETGRLRQDVLKIDEEILVDKAHTTTRNSYVIKRSPGAQTLAAQLVRGSFCRVLITAPLIALGLFELYQIKGLQGLFASIALYCLV
jgi:hypothetical protein